MKRRLLNFLTALSLLLCVAVAAAGGRSYVRMDHLQWAGDKAAGVRVKSWVWDWKLEWGHIDVGRDASTFTFESAEEALRMEQSSAPHFMHRKEPATRARPLGASLWHRLGFFWYHQRSPSDAPSPMSPVRWVSRSSDQWYVRAPLWPLALVTAVLPAGRFVAWSLRRRRSRRLARENRCRACGYDLTGNASGVCPECGAPVPVKASA